ncbi:hypothetical protein NOGI109294_18915 [Nocardiopsis gilva]|uniref:hypothetical protein n=1 Tax=Nocardiopsis gilva TaxID=280236 RepID=UPI00034CC83C|nr:hypothetical protein [Nocardiopsis gilva]
MQEKMHQPGMPLLADPVERKLNTTAASAADGVDQSIFGGITWKDIPFAGDSDE